MNFKLAPSILAADFACLGQQVNDAEAAGADWFHLDVMDGQFVPNISFGPLVIEAIRPLTTLPLDVHLMIEHPETYVNVFAKAGADRITVHVETCPHLHRSIGQIKDLGLKVGVAINPATPISVLSEIITELDLVLIMSVNPGFGGQSYIPHSTAKIAALRAWLDDVQSSAVIQVDGGIDRNTISKAVSAGANVLVAGSAIFNKKASISENITTLRRAVTNHSLG
ncbi:MAG: ribulose-phosphate 3-epimerase [Chloroflexota bacterium]